MAAAEPALTQGLRDGAAASQKWRVLVDKYAWALGASAKDLSVLYQALTRLDPPS